VARATGPRRAGRGDPARRHDEDARCSRTRRPTGGRSRPRSSAASAGTGRPCCATRPLDVWMHEQDVRPRRSTDPAASTRRPPCTWSTTSRVAGLRARQAGGRARRDDAGAEVDAHDPVAFSVDESGRGRRLDDVPDCTHGRPGHGPGVLHRARPAGGREPGHVRSDRRRRSWRNGCWTAWPSPRDAAPRGPPIVTGPTVGGIGYFVAPRAGPRVAIAWCSPAVRRSGSRRVRPRSGARSRRRPGRLVVDGRAATRCARRADGPPTSGRCRSWSTNAGVMGTPNSRTRDGFDLQMATNHWGPFLLTGLCSPSSSRAATAAWSAVSSVGHRWPARTAARSAQQAARVLPVGGRTGRPRWPTSCSPRARPAAGRGRAAGEGAGRPPRPGRHAPVRQRQVGRQRRRIGSIYVAAQRWSPSRRPTAPCPC
jgi:hypothetical protein